MTALLLVLLISLATCRKGMVPAQNQEGSREDSKQPLVSQDRWRQAELEIRRLSPTAFPSLPVAVIKQLQNRGCTVPQVFNTLEAHNVIRGQFTRRGQMDWAVLCSKGGKSSILVFWGKPTKCPNELALEEDSERLQIIGNGRIGYSRSIFAVNGDYILEHYKRYGGPLPPPLDHQGINDAFVEKGSKVYYCYQGKWLRLTGAD